jgi:hypothetical protein
MPFYVLHSHSTEHTHSYVCEFRIIVIIFVFLMSRTCVTLDKITLQITYIFCVGDAHFLLNFMILILLMFVCENHIYLFRDDEKDFVLQMRLKSVINPSLANPLMLFHKAKM